MIEPSGLISAREVWNLFSRTVFAQTGYTPETPDENVDFQSLSEATSELCWAFGRSQASAWVLLPSGATIPASSELFSSVDTSKSIGDHFDWPVGTVGNGDDRSRKSRGASKEQFYGTILNCHMLFERKAVEMYLKTVPDAALIPKWSSRKVAEQIVGSWLDQRQTKAQLRSRFAQGLSSAVFDSVWREAVALEKRLGAPGRPPSQIRVKNPG